jgi:dihydrofolate synthase / folylpolyglutamate synthase
VNADEALRWLFRRTGGGIRWGLERTETMLAGVGNPHRRFRALHVGGTNGKGSVAALCEAALREHLGAAAVGMYTSPHLLRVNERVRIGGRPVEDALLVAATERLRPSIVATGATFFEALTAIGFLALAEAGVEVAVVEVGLGGRLDATNVLIPDAVAITNVGLDHTEHLGGTLEAIAGEKAGILKRGVPAVSGAVQPEVRARLRAGAESVGAPLAFLDERAELRDVETTTRGTRLSFRSSRWGEGVLRTPLVGAHQAANALLALELLALLPADLRPTLGAVERGFAGARWSGRLQIERVRGTTWLLDVAHNPAGAETLAAALDDLPGLPRPLVVVAGILADKDWEGILRPLLDRVDAAILTVPASAPAARLWSPHAAAAALSAHPVRIRVIDDLPRALERASTLAPHGTVLVTGSVHTVGEALAFLDIAPF